MRRRSTGSSDAEKVDGIVAQVRADVGDLSERRVAQVLRQRLEQAGVPYDDALVAASVARVRA